MWGQCHPHLSQVGQLLGDAGEPAADERALGSVGVHACFVRVCVCDGTRTHSCKQRAGGHGSRHTAARVVAPAPLGLRRAPLPTAARLLGSSSQRSGVIHQRQIQPIQKHTRVQEWQRQ